MDQENNEALSPDLPGDARLRTYIEESPSEVAANVIICLIHQTNYLLDQQLRQLEQQFVEEGGFTERLYQVRSQARRKRTT